MKTITRGTTDIPKEKQETLTNAEFAKSIPYYHAAQDYHNFCHRGSDKEWRARFDIGPLYVNACICHKCGWFIRSKNRHDFFYCKCGSVAVDGGSWYARRVFKEGAKFTDVIEYFNDVNPEEPYDAAK